MYNTNWISLTKTSMPSNRSTYPHRPRHSQCHRGQADSVFPVHPPGRRSLLPPSHLIPRTRVIKRILTTPPRHHMIAALWPGFLRFNPQILLQEALRCRAKMALWCGALCHSGRDAGKLYAALCKSAYLLAPDSPASAYIRNQYLFQILLCAHPSSININCDIPVDAARSGQTLERPWLGR